MCPRARGRTAQPAGLVVSARPEHPPGGPVAHAGLPLLRSVCFLPETSAVALMHTFCRESRPHAVATGGRHRGQPAEVRLYRTRSWEQCEDLGPWPGSALPQADCGPGPPPSPVPVSPFAQARGPGWGAVHTMEELSLSLKRIQKERVHLFNLEKERTSQSPGKPV